RPRSPHEARPLPPQAPLTASPSTRVEAAAESGYKRPDMDGLNHRARTVLSAIVQEYLETGTPVGSRTITRHHGVDISPATVRNVMSDLEDAGLLSQPHTSAGRVPTPQGRRS